MRTNANLFIKNKFEKLDHLAGKCYLSKRSQRRENVSISIKEKQNVFKELLLLPKGQMVSQKHSNKPLEVMHLDTLPGHRNRGKISKLL